MNPLHSVLLVAALLCVGTASAEQEVNVYSYRQPFLIRPLFDAFTKETGIKVNVVFAEEGLVERLKREGANSPADLIFTVDIGRLSDAVEADLVQPVQSPVLTANIPAQFRDPGNLWFGLTTRARIFAVSKERVAPGEATSYEALAEPQWKGRICTRSGKHVYSVALTAAMIAHHGEAEAEKWLTGLKNNLARRPQGNDRAQVKAVKEGQCDLALINSYYVGNMMADKEQAEWVAAVNIVFPNQDSTGTHVNISGMAMTRSAPNPENAKKLMEFLSGDLAQQIYAEQNYEYPVNPQVPWSGLLKSWGEFKVDSLPLAQIAQYRTAAIKLADKVGYDD
ncbi:MAG: Fe(3+) ABC transporter substrate-binding protein [Gammaproteobacteria bacterium]|nr:Fe(3+) ABC transporter substrate-binding protein [Gammaproteobacteria bacterium]MCP5424642.1 Fe(3+) ABC transporter substrate-binding protein [Gammaproteobacteria bacterium]